MRNRKGAIRHLEPGASIPTTTPRRYVSQRGYIQLTWRIGPNSYVRTYEHRVVDGRITTAEHVHHKNGDHADNRPENLVHMTAEEHLLAHHPTYVADTARMRELYEGGLSTTQIARQMGVDSSSVSRRLRAGGVAIRPKQHTGAPLDRNAVIAAFREGGSVEDLRAQFAVSRPRIVAILDEAGVPRQRRRGPRPVVIQAARSAS